MKRQLPTKSGLIFLLCTGFFILIGTNAIYGQDVADQPAEDIEVSKHSLHIELAGRTLIFGSLNYEYAITDRFSAGFGLGVANILIGKVTQFTGQTSKTGNYFDTFTTQMLYVNYDVWKRRRHAFYISAGVTAFTETYRTKFPTETEFSIYSQVQWNAGIGYEYNPGKFFFRVSPYAIAMPQPSGWFPPYVPWLGLSAGLKL